MPKAIDPKDSYLFQPLVLHRAKMPLSKRRRMADPDYLIPWLFPRAAEKEYARTLTKDIDFVVKAFLQYVEPQYQSWKSEYHQDAYPSELEELTVFINRLQEEIFGNVKEYRTAYLLKKATQIDVFNMEQWGKFTGALLGADSGTTILLPQETWHQTVIDSWVAKNYTLWTNVTQQFINRATSIVADGVERGLLWTDTRDNLLNVLPKKNGQPNYNRANLIARDQTAKLNSSLTQRRSQEAGANYYKWITGNDERVRGNPNGKYPKAVPSHYIMNKKTGRWDDEDVISDDRGRTFRPKRGKEEPRHVGYAVQCRCTGTPVFWELIGEADKYIEENDLDLFY